MLVTTCVFADSKTNLIINKSINPVVFFVDRINETKAILSNLKIYKIVSIIGVTSMGKTELARKYASYNKKRYELIWFFDSSIDLNEQFVSLANKINNSLLLQNDHKISEDPNMAQQEIMNFLTERENWLLVFDNLRLGQNNKLDNIIKWNHNGHIIICSQDSKDLPNNIFLHKLDKENALILLQKILGKELNSKDLLEKLVEIFEGYPGPIVQGAFLLKEHNYLSLEEYKNILAKSSDPVKSHMELVLNLLSDNDKKLLLYIAVLNNQNFSKNLLKIIYNGLGNIGEGLYNLNRFGLIKNTEKINDTSLFEMHDIVKEGVLRYYTEQQIKETISEIISKLNLLMPRGVTSRYAFISKDATMKSNLEVLLDNAERYKANIYKILEFRKNLIDYYVVSLDYYNVEKMKQWLEHKEQNQLFLLSKMHNKQKINYGWYLVDIGIYEDFAKSNYTRATSYFNRAKEAIRGIENEPELETTILFQTAQTQVFGGDVSGAEENIEKVNYIIKQHPEADFDMGLYWFIKARIFLAQGKYNEALIAVDNNIKAEAHLPQDTFTAPTYVLKSEILNFIGDYQKSYQIIKKLKEQEISGGPAEHELHARILTQLSRAELGLGLVDEAFTHIITACNIFQKEISKYAITAIMNTDYAAALITQGDILYTKQEYTQALEAYNKGEIIYLRRYGNNYRYMDDIVYLLSQGLKVSCINKNKFWRKHFYNQLLELFDDKHPRIIEAMKYCKDSAF